MDEFGILTESFGLKPQGKSPPMAASKGTRNFGSNSGLGNAKLSSYYSRSAPNSSPIGGSLRRDHDVDGFFSSIDSREPQNFNNSDDYGDLFGGGTIKYSKPSDDRGGGSSFDYDSIFGVPNDAGSKSSTLPVYDDVVFDSVPGLKSSASVKNDELLTSIASPPKSNMQFDDLLGNLDKRGSEFKGLYRKSSGEVVKNAAGFDDLITGFGGSSAPKNGSAEDPFVVVESLEQVGKFNNSGSNKADTSSVSGGIYDNEVDGLAKPVPIFSAEINYGDRDRSPLRTRSNEGSFFPSSPHGQYSCKTAPDGVKSSILSSIDELEDFAMGGVRISVNEHSDILSSEVEAETFAPEHILREKEKKEREWRRLEKKRETAHEGAAAAQDNQQINKNDLESFFSMGPETSSVPRAKATASDPVFDPLFQNRGGPEVTQSSSAGASSSMNKDSSSTNIFDDLSFMFGVAASSREFHEIEGESEERRGARLKRHQETNERMAKAVADMNKRDFESQQEQEEKHRIAETVNNEIKHWAAGKEGNLRALLSTLQFVLWPECGWQPVSLTDLITSVSVKKVYRKATLCIHPDKVRQKGATIKQKYRAEKVFDLLKEAWNKFNSEELC